jgi:hypothetical protein
MNVRRVTTIQAEWGISLTGNNNNSCTFKDIKFYDPNTGGGGIDLKENCHATTISSCAFENKATGSRNPAYGIRLAVTGQSSAVSIRDCNFDYYRVTSAHFKYMTDCKGFVWDNNYIECRDDGITNAAILISGGGGSITGGRISTGGTGIDYAINFFGNAHDWHQSGTYFSGFDLAAIRIANGASNINIGSNNLIGGLTHVNDQNVLGAKSSTVVQDGNVITEIVTPDKLVITVAEDLIIESGEITAVSSFIRLDTESATSSDDLDTINGGTDGMILIIAGSSNSRDVTIKDNVGNIRLSSDFIFVNARDKLMLIYDANALGWTEISRSTN